MRLEALQKSFESDISRHEMTVLFENGVYRHIRFRRPDTWAYGFDLITWPGFLAYTGDMGEYMFSRVEDMFTFFRQPLDQGISYSYWSEKCRAGQRSGKRDCDGVYEFSEEAFKEAVEEDFKSWLEYNLDSESGLDTVAELRERLEDEVLSCSSEGMIRAYDAAVGFEVDGEQIFQDFWERSCEEYTDRFVWCCHAIRWGIHQYDELKAMHPEEAVNALHG